MLEQVQLTSIVEEPGYWTNASTNLKVIKSEIDNWLYDKLGGKVQTGPFEGMTILKETSRKDIYFSPMLLGCYEEEIHGALERQIQRLEKLDRPPQIGVIGSAEGYYAIGLKRRLPNADVYVAEPDKKSLDICMRAAAVNGVEIKTVDINRLMSGADLLVSDCEGNEVFYLDIERWPYLSQINMIVEIHNYPATEKSPELKTDQILLDRFRSSHRINLIFEGGRNPNQYEWLCGMVSDYRWAAVSEGRPCLMGWYIMEPKGVYRP